MRTEALLLLDDRYAQRLTATWDAEIAALEGDDRLRAWAAAAAVPIEITRRHARSLLRAEICRADGTVDELARQYLQKKVRDTLRG